MTKQGEDQSIEQPSVQEETQEENTALPPFQGDVQGYLGSTLGSELARFGAKIWAKSQRIETVKRRVNHTIKNTTYMTENFNWETTFCTLGFEKRDCGHDLDQKDGGNAVTTETMSA